MDSNLTIHIALPYLAVLALMYFVLSLLVIKSRLKNKVGLGNGKNLELMQVMRVHGNFAEYVPLVALMLIVLELNMTISWLVHFFWICLIVGRVAHAQGVMRTAGKSEGRMGGTILTFIAMVGASISMLVQFLLR